MCGLATRSGDEIGEGFPVRIFFGDIHIFRWPFKIKNLVLESKINQKGKERKGLLKVKMVMEICESKGSR